MQARQYHSAKRLSCWLALVDHRCGSGATRRSLLINKNGDVRVKNLTNKLYASWGDPGYTDQIILGAPRSYKVAASFKW